MAPFGPVSTKVAAAGESVEPMFKGFPGRRGCRITKGATGSLKVPLAPFGPVSISERESDAEVQVPNGRPEPFPEVG